MKKKVLVIGGIAATTLLVGGWALAQSPVMVLVVCAGGMMGMRGQWARACAAKWGPACGVKWARA